MNILHKWIKRFFSLFCISALLIAAVDQPIIVMANENQSSLQNKQSDLEKQARSKILILKNLRNQAKTREYDVEREDATIWMAEQFLKFANWDENHIAENEKIFKAAPMYKNKDTQKLAEELPDFERREVIKMVEKSIQDLRDVMDGKVVRTPVRKVEWDKVTVKGDQFVNSDGSPVFLYDYFSKANGASQNDPNLYNDYIGNIVHPLSLSPLMCATENGELNDRAKNEVINFDKYYPGAGDKIGYMFLWHSGKIIPQWAIDKYGEENLKKGIPKYTSYDIDNPHMREIWTKIFDKLIPKVKNIPQTTLGYILTNEPHWVTDKSNKWFAVKNGVSEYTLNKFRNWLKAKYNNDISRLNSLWKTNYKTFNEITVEVPMDISSIRGTPKNYDWCRFNMDRVTEWFTFLHDGIKKNDSDARTHFKIFPKFITGEDGYRDHGIDIEAISNLTEFLGNDVTIRKALFNAKKPEEWEEKYAYYWREIAMMNDLLSSFGPDKININSESHFISTNTYRDINMQPKYVRSVYWLSTILGTKANLTWWWPRYGDGSIEPRLLNGAMNPQGYPGSVVQMPRVANEITQTFMDLNAFSTDIVKFQRQEKPIRVFYSETENINDKDQINKVFDLYESMYFNGVPIGFATKGILEEPKDNFDVVVIYDTERVTDEEFASVQKYLDNGGTVIIDDVSLTKNEYNETRKDTLKQSKGKLIKVTKNKVATMSSKAFDIIKDKMPIVNIVEENGLDQKGCIWRVVDGDDPANKLVTVVNVGKNEATLTISKKDNPNATIVDMFTGQEMSKTITLEPEGVLFLNVGTKDPKVKGIVSTDGNTLKEQKDKIMVQLTSQVKEEPKQEVKEEPKQEVEEQNSKDALSTYLSFDTYKAQPLKSVSGTTGKWWINEGSIMSISKEKSYTETGEKQSLLFDGDPSKASVPIFFATAPRVIKDTEKFNLPSGKYYIEAMIYLEGDSMSDIDVYFAKTGKGVMSAKLACSSAAKKGQWVKVKSTVFKSLDGKEENAITPDLQLRFLYPSKGKATKFYIDNIQIVKTK